MTRPLPSATAVDLELALAFYAVLVQRARLGRTLTYSDLVDDARAMFPDNATVQKAIPVSAGRRLDFVRHFTEQRGLPDLAALVVSKSTGEVGAGSNGSTAPDAARAAICAFDWQGVEAAFTGEVTLARESLSAPKPKAHKPLTYDKAAELMYAHYKEQEPALRQQGQTESVRQARERIIALIRAGRSPANAFAEALA